MNKVTTIAAALLMGFTFSSFAGNGDDRKENNSQVVSEVEAVSTPTESSSSEESKDFYVDDNGNRLDYEYPLLGDCEASSTENCHATFTRPNASSPWVQQGAIQKGIRPF